MATNVSICTDLPVGGPAGSREAAVRREAAGEMVGIFLTVAEWQIPTILEGPTEGKPTEGNPTEGNPTEERGRPTATPANAMDCSRGMRLLLRRLLLDELLNGLLSLNGLGAGAHPALLD